MLQRLLRGLRILQEQLETQAMLDGISFSFFISTIVAIVALVLAFFMKRVTQPTNEKSVTKPEESEQKILG